MHVTLVGIIHDRGEMSFTHTFNGARVSITVGVEQTTAGIGLPWSVSSVLARRQATAEGGTGIMKAATATTGDARYRHCSTGSAG